MEEAEVKKKLIAAGVSLEIAIENLQSILGTNNLFLGELILNSIPILVEQERKMRRLRELMDPDKDDI